MREVNIFYLPSDRNEGGLKKEPVDTELLRRLNELYHGIKEQHIQCAESDLSWLSIAKMPGIRGSVHGCETSIYPAVDKKSREVIEAAYIILMQPPEQKPVENETDDMSDLVKLMLLDKAVREPRWLIEVNPKKTAEQYLVTSVRKSGRGYVPSRTLLAKGKPVERIVWQVIDNFVEVEDI